MVKVTGKSWTCPSPNFIPPAMGQSGRVRTPRLMFEFRQCGVEAARLQACHRRRQWTVTLSWSRERRQRRTTRTIIQVSV